MTEEEAKRHGAGMALLLLAQSDSAEAYFILKQLGLCIADLQEVGFTEADIAPLKMGWMEVRKRIEDSRKESSAPLYDA